VPVVGVQKHQNGDWCEVVCPQLHVDSHRRWCMVFGGDWGVECHGSVMDGGCWCRVYMCRLTREP